MMFIGYNLKVERMAGLIWVRYLYLIQVKGTHYVEDIPRVKCLSIIVSGKHV